MSRSREASGREVPSGAGGGSRGVGRLRSGVRSERRPLARVIGSSWEETGRRSKSGADASSGSRAGDGIQRSGRNPGQRSEPRAGADVSGAPGWESRSGATAGGCSGAGFEVRARREWRHRGGGSRSGADASGHPGRAQGGFGSGASSGEAAAARRSLRSSERHPSSAEVRSAGAAPGPRTG